MQTLNGVFTVRSFYCFRTGHSYLLIAFGQWDDNPDFHISFESNCCRSDLVSVPPHPWSHFVYRAEALKTQQLPKGRRYSAQPLPSVLLESVQAQLRVTTSRPFRWDSTGAGGEQSRGGGGFSASRPLGFQCIRSSPGQLSALPFALCLFSSALLHSRRRASCCTPRSQHG